MSLRKSRLYPAEFKQSSVKLAIEFDQSISKTARDLDVNENTLRTWINFYSKHKEVASLVEKSYPTLPSVLTVMFTLPTSSFIF